jgi:tetratricopeptide (TPR) repeat protein
MRVLFFVLLIAGGMAAQGQTSDSPAPSKSQSSPAKSPAQAKDRDNPKLAPPRSDKVDASSLGNEAGESSSKDTQIDISPPADDAKTHPQSSEVLTDEGSSAGGDTMEFHPWDPHKAAKDVEVGDYYFKRKNYVGAESRYREALFYKENDAEATYKLAICLEKMDRLDEAVAEYERYLKILPSGPEADPTKKAIERLKNPAVSAKPKP